MSPRDASAFTLIIVPLALSACATVMIPVPIAQPARINPAGCRVEIGSLSNDPDQALATMLRAALADRGGAPGPCTMNVSGTFAGDYHEDVKDFHFTQGGINGDSNVVHFYTRWGTATARASLLLKNPAEGTSLGALTLEDTEKTVNRAAPDLLPAFIDRDALLKKARQKIVQQFLAAITPERRQVDTKFFHAGRLPALNEEIALARDGHLDTALPIATAAIDSGERAHLPIDVIGMAYWDRAMVRELLGQYGPARDDIQHASIDLGDPDLLDELQHLAALEKQDQGR